MADEKAVDSLITEIDKIVSARYAVLLKPLSYVLGLVDDGQLYLWTLVRACQIPALVSHLLDVLDQDEAAWPVTLRLIRVLVIRDEVIRQDPEFLRKLFSDTGDRHVFEACVALCEHPFSENFPHPPEYFDFISSVLTNSHNDPEASWITNVCSVLSNILPTTLMTVSKEAVRRCMTIWNEASRAVDNTIFVKFMTIAAIMHLNHAKGPCGTRDDHSPLPESKSDPLIAWTQKCSSLFADSKAQKIIKGLLLRTLYFMSETTNILNTKAAECLGLIKFVLGVMPLNALRSALGEQEIVQILRKVIHKLECDNITATVRLCTLSILLVVDPECRLWDIMSLHTTFSQFVRTKLEPKWTSDATKPPNPIDDLNFFYGRVSVFQELMKRCVSEKSALQAIMQYLIGWCHPSVPPTAETVWRLKSADIYVKTLESLIVSDELHDDVLSCIIRTEIPAWWNWNNYPSKYSPTCQNSKICPLAIDTAKRELASGTSSLIIRAASTSKLFLNQAQYQSLYTNQCYLRPSSNNDCHIWPRIRHRQQNCTTSTRMPACQDHCNPEQRLEKTLSVFNEHTLKTIYAYIDDTCRDLQRRCEGIEAPLDMERTKNEALQKALTEAQQSQDIVLADYRARRLSWQNSLELERKETASLTQYREETEARLRMLEQQLQAEKEEAESARSSTINIQKRYDALLEVLKQEKKRAEELKTERSGLSEEIQGLQRQLKDGRDMEQKLLCVLRGSSMCDA